MSEPSTAALLHKVKILEDKLAAAEEEKGELTASKQVWSCFITIRVLLLFLSFYNSVDMLFSEFVFLDSQ